MKISEEENLQDTLCKIKCLIDALRSFHLKEEISMRDPFQMILDHLISNSVSFSSPLRKEQKQSHNSPSISYAEILQLAIFPLLQSVENSLRKIDEIHTAQPTNNNNNMAKNKTGMELEPHTTTNDYGNKKKSRSKPKPPPGMLSIKQYTDIACLLEYFLYFLFFPYKTILPISISIRIQRLLPKSLRGRMYPGARQLDRVFQIMTEKELSRSGSRSISNEKCSTQVVINETSNELQFEMKELHSHIQLFGDIITQSRFRPMFLPRHLSDYYALVFLHNHLLQKQQRQKQKQQQKQQQQQQHKQLANTTQIEEYTFHISIKPYFAPHIDGTIVAKALQSLMYTNTINDTSTTNRKRNKSQPPWLRSKVTYWLNHLASKDLVSILHVFVIMAHNLPGATISTAASHLSRALITVSPTITYSTIAADISQKQGTRHNHVTNEMDCKTIRMSTPSKNPITTRTKNVTMSKKVWEQLLITLGTNSIINSSTSNSNNHSNINHSETNPYHDFKKNIELASGLVIIYLLTLLSQPQSYVYDILCRFPEVIHPKRQSNCKEIHHNNYEQKTPLSPQLNKKLSWRTIQPINPEKQMIGVKRLKFLLELLPPPPFCNQISELLLKHEALDILLDCAVSISIGNVEHVVEKREVMGVMKHILESYMEDDGYSNTNISVTTNDDNSRNGNDRRVGDSPGVMVVKKSVVYLMKAIMNSLHSYDSAPMSTASNDVLNSICVDTANEDKNNKLMKNFLLQLEIRCKIVAKIVCTICESSSNNNQETLQHEETSNSHMTDDVQEPVKWRLGSILFELVLILCYTSQQKTDIVESSGENQIFLDKCLQSNKARLVSMTLLPILLSECGPAILLKASPYPSTLTDTGNRSISDASGILNMIGWIIHSAAEQMHAMKLNHNMDAPDTNSKQEQINLSSPDIQTNFHGWDIGVGKLEEHRSSVNREFDAMLERSNIAELGASSIHSTASICIGILVAMLELGEEKRHAIEEEMLKSFLPDLKQLASLSHRRIICQPMVNDNESTRSNDNDDNEHNDSMGAEIAEMAIHACVLIASRQTSMETNAENTCLFHDQKDDVLDMNSMNSKSHVYLHKIHQAHLDLKSEMPPIRARGAVSVLRLARAITDAHDSFIQNKISIINEKVNGNESEYEQRRIMELQTGKEKFVFSNDSLHWNGVKKDELYIFIGKLLEIAIFALKDDDSYVYMAAIQAVSAIGDTRPTVVLPILATALSKGKLMTGHMQPNKAWNIRNESNDEWKEDCKDIIHLTKNQRVKIAEAIIFAIRRRGKSYTHNMKAFVEEILRGCGCGSGSGSGCLRMETKTKMKRNTRNMQIETELYFENDFQNDEPENEHEIFGGDEEARIEKAEDRRNRLKTGGPVFDVEEDDMIRSSCYSCLSEVIYVFPVSVYYSFCGRMIDLCISSLQLDISRLIRRSASLLAGDIYRCILFRKGKDSDNYDHYDFNDSLCIAVEMIRSKEEVLYQTMDRIVSSRSDDHATVARCKEALAARTACEEMGLFTAARVVAQRQQMEDSSNVPSAIRTMLD